MLAYGTWWRWQVAHMILFAQFLNTPSPPTANSYSIRWGATLRMSPHVLEPLVAPLESVHQTLLTTQSVDLFYLFT